jgi:hypothetical protein
MKTVTMEVRMVLVLLSLMSAVYQSFAPTPILKPPVDDFKVESAVPFSSD